MSRLLEFAGRASQSYEVAARLDTVYGVSTKTASNRRRGLSTYIQGMSPWEGYPVELFNRKITTLLEFDDQATAAIRNRIRNQLIEIAANHGIKFAQTDLPPHMTLQFPHFPEDIGAELMQSITANIKTDLQEVTDDLIGQELPQFDSLVLTGSQLYIAGEDPKASQKSFNRFWRIVKARDEINDVIGNQGIHLDDLNYYDLTHSVVGRITSVGPDPSRLSAFAAEAYAVVGIPLQANPIKAKIERVHVGSARPIMERLEPKILWKR